MTNRTDPDARAVPAEAVTVAATPDVDAERQRMLLLLRAIDQAWVSAFRESGFHDIYFSRLFTELWLHDDRAIGKTEAYDLVKEVSVQTAIKYVRRAIAEGYLEEFDNPADRRSRLLRMTPSLKERFAGVLDRLRVAVEALDVRRLR